VTGYALTAGHGIDERLSLHVVEVDGRLEGSTGDRQEILYVLSGSGTLRLDRDEERADARRTFRVLHEGELTQFIGIVEPCRAPDHSHPYDEVGYIVEGEGVAHIGGDRVPLRAGSCFYLPPGCVHCIENTGPGVMRIMGVFHPAGSPKQRSYDAAGS